MGCSYLVSVEIKIPLVIMTLREGVSFLTDDGVGRRSYRSDQVYANEQSVDHLSTFMNFS